jgi:pimeloyl-ACP methyl ester carboxylesterase
MPLITCGEFTVDYMDVGEGPPVILIPSSGSGNRQWRKLVGELSDRYRMLSMNLFGY